MYAEKFFVARFVGGDAVLCGMEMVTFLNYFPKQVLKQQRYTF